MSYVPFNKAWVRVKRSTPDGKITISLMAAFNGAYEPGYAPRPCSDPDHPAYSDPGSPSDVEIHDLVEVEDVEIDCDEDELGKDDQALLQAAAAFDDDYLYWRRVCEDYREVLSVGEVLGKERRQEHQLKADEAQEKAERFNLAGEWLRELFACRHGLGPWSHIELTEKELRELEDGAVEELEDERQAAEEHAAEMQLEERRLRRRFGDDW